MQITGLGTITVINNASEEVEEEIPALVARGEKMSCYGLTEPGTGSDAAGIQCRARRENGSWVINGRKRYISFCSSICLHNIYSL